VRPLLLAAGLRLLAAPAASAQVTFGLKAGFNVAEVSYDDGFEDALEASGVEQEPRLGFTAGVFADVAITPALTVHPEVLYSQKGSMRAPRAAVVNGGVTRELAYVEVPVLLSLRAPAVLNGLVFGVEGGPTFAHKVSTGVRCSGVYQEVCEAAGEPAENADRDGFRDYDLGAALGLTVGTGPFHFGARVTRSLTTVNDPEFEEAVTSARNQVFSVAAHYTFGN
jgi:hypothetical protein